MISLCAKPKTDRTHGLVSRCNNGFEVTALSLAAMTGYRKSEPLIAASKTNFVNEKVKELPLLPQRTYGQRRSIFYGLFLQHSSITRGEDDCQATGISRSWNCTKYGIEHSQTRSRPTDETKSSGHVKLSGKSREKLMDKCDSHAGQVSLPPIRVGGWHCC